MLLQTADLFADKIVNAINPVWPRDNSTFVGGLDERLNDDR